MVCRNTPTRFVAPLCLAFILVSVLQGMNISGRKGSRTLMICRNTPTRFVAPLCLAFILVLVLQGIETTDTDNDRTKRTSEIPVPEASCVAWGLDHYRTFDNKIYSFHGQCTYTLAYQPDAFVIMVVNDLDCDTSGKCKRGLNVFFGTVEVQMRHTSKGFKVLWDGKDFQVPGSRLGTVFEQFGSYLMVRSSMGFYIKWDGNSFVHVKVSENLKGKVAGLCGKYSGDSTDDFESSDGKVLTSVINFATSWRQVDLSSGGSTCTESIPPTECSADTSVHPSQTSSQRCNDILVDPSFQKCLSTVDPKPYFESCKQDCCGKTGTDCTCEAFAAYSRACMSLGVKMDWRKPGRCEVTCQGAKVYKECGSSCPPDCKNQNPTCSDTTCLDGCFCPFDQVLHNGQCIYSFECTCDHNGVSYMDSETISQDCNTCTCQAGKWQCTKKNCGATCMVSGDPHYITFDGSRYSFEGTCSYFLLKNSTFAIVVDKRCGHIEETCTRSVSVYYEGQQAMLDHNNQLYVNGQEVASLPYSVPEFNVRMVSSLFMELKLSNDVDIHWDGVNRISIKVPPAFIGGTQGLCGTYDGNQGNDFLTPSNIQENNPNIFGNQWKTDSRCPDVPTTLQPNPCENQVQKKEEAKKLCEVLKESLFQACHSTEDVDDYYKQCMSDVCSCAGNIKNCLCPSMGTYADICASKGVKIQWRDKVAECKVKCFPGQVYQVCGRPCERTCRNMAENTDPLCNQKCVEGCNCPDGESLNDNGECVPVKDCPCIFDGRDYQPGFVTLMDSKLCTCKDARWKCEKVNFNTPIGRIQPLCPQFMEFHSCAPSCPATCVKSNVGQTCVATHCQPGCVCQEGYLRDGEECVRKDHCPCHHGGKPYYEGDSFYDKCNKCTCKNQTWECENNDCPGICSIYGDSHFSTFDGRKYEFQGTCDYILAQSTELDPDKMFTITMQNVQCGTSGVACSKSIDFIVGKEGTNTYHRLKLIKGRRVVPGPQSPFKVEEIGEMVYISTPNGISLQWDKGTRLYVKVDASFMKKVQGLCGNFNGDRIDDFTKPQGGPPEVKATKFGDSWKVHSYCADSTDIQDTCDKAPERQAWAKLKCSILASDLFEPCHATLPYAGYRERCEFDACACDKGGDCECLCTAIAAYAHECATNGIVINWRSKKLCGLECSECKSYNPCMSRCPKKTCDNRLFYEKITKDCKNEHGVCFEGCDFHPCPAGQVYDSLVEPVKCVPEPICNSPSCDINGKKYREGERIDDPGVCRLECEICNCRNGTLDHIKHGECKPMTPTPRATLTPMLSTVTSPGMTPKTSPLTPLGSTLSTVSSGSTLSTVSPGSTVSTKSPGSTVSTISPGSTVSTKSPGSTLSTVSPGHTVSTISPGHTVSTISPGHTVSTISPGHTVSTISPGSTLTSTVDPTAVTCPPGQIWMPCAFKCEEVCVGIQQKNRVCNGNGTSDCIPGCRDGSAPICQPEERLNARNICIRKEYCPCLKPDGTEALPLETWPNPQHPCTECSCFNNEIVCDAYTDDCTTTPLPTTPSPTSPPYTCGWSHWINTDTPRNGPGDMELLSRLQVTEGLCAVPASVECRGVTSKKDWKSLGQNVSCNRFEGLKCFNFQNPSMCFDYEIRVFCPCPSTTEPPSTVEVVTTPTTPRPLVCGWTDWFSINKPSSRGEYEYFAPLRTLHSICDASSIIGIECRDVVTKKKAAELGQNVQCDLKYGLLCFNFRQRSRSCVDYEVRIYCDPVRSGCSNVSTENWSTSKFTTAQTTIDVSTQKPPKPICDDELGLKSGRIRDDMISASSQRDNDHSAASVRLDSSIGWMPEINDKNQYIQIDFGRNDVIVTGIMVQGSPTTQSSVTSYKVTFSSDGKNWNTLMESSTNEKIFDVDWTAGVGAREFFTFPLRTRFVRIHPVTWNDHIAMRMELLGCPTVYPTVTTTLSTTPPITSPTTETVTFIKGSSTTPSIPDCTNWTMWLDTNQPSLAKKDDEELIQNLLALVPSCTPPLGIECRTATPDHIPHDATGEDTSCTLWNGFMCHARGGNICMNYEVRLECFKATPECLPTFTPTLPPSQLCFPTLDQTHCPEAGCAAGLFCNGSQCVPKAQCPCEIEDEVIRPGGMKQTKNCDTCQCLNGETICMPKTCPPSTCQKGKVTLNQATCNCDCLICKTDEFQCSNGPCIPIAKRCDSFVDCVDDELNCGSSQTPATPPTLPTPSTGVSTNPSSLTSSGSTTQPTTGTKGRCALVTCPRLKIPQLKIGLTVKVVKTNDGCCFKYLVCDLSTCPPRPRCPDPYMSEEIPGTDCCSKYRCVCPPKCIPPTTPVCPSGQEVIEIYQGCNCTSLACGQVPSTPPPTQECRYTLEYGIVDGKEQKIANQSITIYKPTESWSDGLCKTCRCTNETGRAPNVLCELTKCANCDLGSKKVEVPGSCCGKCEPTGCQVGKTLYKVGETIPSSKNCFNKTCEKDSVNGSFIIQESQVKCENFDKLPYCPDDAKSVDIYDATGCCMKCVPRDVFNSSNVCSKCAPVLAFGQPIDSIGYFTLTLPTGITCSNENPLPDLRKCMGYCQSGSEYSHLLDWSYACQSCQEDKRREVTVNLRCSDGLTISRSYDVPESCSCRNCFRAT